MGMGLRNPCPPRPVAIPTFDTQTMVANFKDQFSDKL